MTHSSMYKGHIPKRIETDDSVKIYFVRKIGTKARFVHMSPEDQQYVIGWLNRFVIDMCAKQVVEPMFLENIMQSSDAFPKSHYANKRNSVLSYCSGIVSNSLRNPGENLGFNQLPFIEKLFNIIYHLYNDLMPNEIGYHWYTKEQNDPPKQIKFIEA